MSDLIRLARPGRPRPLHVTSRPCRRPTAVCLPRRRPRRRRRDSLTSDLPGLNPPVPISWFQTPLVPYPGRSAATVAPSHRTGATSTWARDPIRGQSHRPFASRQYLLKRPSHGSFLCSVILHRPRQRRCGRVRSSSLLGPWADSPPHALLVPLPPKVANMPESDMAIAPGGNNNSSDFVSGALCVW